MSTWTLVDSLDAPTAGVFTFTGLSLGAYKLIQIHGIGLTVTTDGSDIKLTFYVGGVEITGTAYQWAMFQTTTGGSNLDDKASGTAAILLCSDNSGNDLGNSASKSAGFLCTVDEPGSAALHKKVVFLHNAIAPANAGITSPGVGLMANAGAIDGIKISATSDFLAGKIRIMGLA